jgi:hypothetical protein
VPKKNNPGCTCCGPSCTIKEDDFTRSDGAIGGDWTAASWTISSNAATTSTDNASAISATTALDSEGVITATFTGDDFSDEFELLISWEDASDYLFARFTLAASAGACGSIKLYKREGGTNTQLGSTRTVDDFEPDVAHTVGICRDGSRLTAFRESGTDYTSVADDGIPGTITGVQAGFASGSIAAAITVDDFLWSRYSAECRDCAAPCEFFSDDFNRADDTDLGCNWTEQAGTAEILSNVLSLGANSLVSTTPATPTGVQLAMATIDAAANNDAARVIVRYTDTSNYLFGEIVFGTTNSTLNIYQRSGGTNTLRGTTTLTGRTVSQVMILRVCYYGNTLTAQVYGTGILASILFGSVAQVISSPPSGFYAGVATAAASSAITFEDFQLLKHNETGETECDECTGVCNLCDVAYQPFAAYTVDLGAPPLTDDECEYCDQIGGDYLLERSTCVATCAWRYCVPDVCDRTVTACSSSRWSFSVTLTIEFVSSGVMKWRLRVGYIPGNNCPCTVDASCAGIFIGATYESADQSAETRCQDVPITLTKTTDTFESSGLCVDSMPATVDLARAV